VAQPSVEAKPNQENFIRPKPNKSFESRQKLGIQFYLMTGRNDADFSSSKLQRYSSHCQSIVHNCSESRVSITLGPWGSKVLVHDSTGGSDTFLMHR